MVTIDFPRFSSVKTRLFPCIIAVNVSPETVLKVAFPFPFLIAFAIALESTLPATTHSERGPTASPEKTREKTRLSLDRLPPVTHASALPLSQVGTVSAQNGARNVEEDEDEHGPE